MRSLYKTVRTSYIPPVHLLRNRNLAAVIAAELVSLTGSSMTLVALPWFVLLTTGSTARMGWVLAAELLPVGLLGIPAGSLISRLGAKRTMNVADLARAPLMAAIPILHWTGHLSFGVLLALTFLVGCFIAPYYASSRLILPEVVGDDEQLVAQGGAFLQAATQLTQLGGPVLGGLLIAWLDAPAVLVVDAATYAFSFVVIFTFVRAGKRVEPDASSQGVLAGLRFLLRDRVLGPMLGAAAFINFAAQGILALIPVLVLRRYDADPKILGFCFASFGAGALLGSLVAAQVVRKVPLLKLAGLAILGMALPLWFVAISMPWPVFMVVFAVFGAFAPLVNAPLLSILTVRPPLSLRPKVITVGQALQQVGIRVVALGIAAGFTAAALAFSAATRRADAGEEEAHPVPAGDLAPVFPAEPRPD
jgi:predicted MFS family arabinose efflux permease